MALLDLNDDAANVRKRAEVSLRAAREKQQDGNRVELTLRCSPELTEHPVRRERRMRLCPPETSP